MTRKWNIVKWLHQIRSIVPIVTEEDSADIFIYDSPDDVVRHLNLDDLQSVNANVDKMGLHKLNKPHALVG